MRKAIVNDSAGTTRDRHYGTTDWCGREFSVIDTGGYAMGGEDIFEAEIRKQVVLAIEEADVILFLVEVSTGITDLDMVMADLLRRSSKKVILVVNKIDNNDQIYSSHEFYALGLGDPYCISAMSGSGTGEVMDAVVAALPEDAGAEQADDLPKFAVIGRPNVGKSSLTNALLDTERNIVTPVAGTTRDSILSRYNKFGMDFYLIDTAGLRKKAKVTEDLEFYSVLRSIRSIESSDVCILMLDATAGIEAQDLNIFNLVVRNKKGCVIVVNKWDLIEKESNTMKEFAEAIRRRIAPFSDVPIVFTSVMNKQRILDVLQTAMRVYYSRIRPRRRLRFSSTCLSTSKRGTAVFWRIRSANDGTSRECRSRSFSARNKAGIFTNDIVRIHEKISLLVGSLLRGLFAGRPGACMEQSVGRRRRQSRFAPRVYQLSDP